MQDNDWPSKNNVRLVTVHLCFHPCTCKGRATCAHASAHIGAHWYHNLAACVHHNYGQVAPEVDGIKQGAAVPAGRVAARDLCGQKGSYKGPVQAVGWTSLVGVGASVGRCWWIPAAVSTSFAYGWVWRGRGQCKQASCWTMLFLR